MMTERKRWWRLAAIATVGGGAMIGSWYSFAHASPAPKGVGAGAGPESWAASGGPTPTAAESRRTAEPTPTGPVTPVGGVALTPALDNGLPPPALPVAPPAIPPAPLPLPPGEPGVGPRKPDAGLAERDALPPVPAVPASPPAKLPTLPAPPKLPDLAPSTPSAPTAPVASPAALPVPGTPPQSSPTPIIPTTVEPPKAQKQNDPVAPVVPTLPQPPEFAPSIPPAKSADPTPPIPPAKLDSGLKPNKPDNTLNPTVPSLAPIALPPSGAGGAREAPGKPVDRPKPPESKFGSTDKYVFPIPAAPDPLVSHHRDDAMLKFTTAAAAAVLGGALVAPQETKAFPTIPPSAIIPLPAAPVRDDKTEIEKLKTDLAAANAKIDKLEKLVNRLDELVLGKKDSDGRRLTNPQDHGSVEDVKELKNQIDQLKKELQSFKTQTSLKPSVGSPPEAKGVVKVDNQYPVEVTMLINNKTYRIAPKTKIEVEVPAGEFTYQLLESGAPATRSKINDKEPVTLKIK